MLLLLLPLGEGWLTELHPRLLNLGFIGREVMLRRRGSAGEDLRIGRGKDDIGRHPTLSGRAAAGGCTVDQVSL